MSMRTASAVCIALLIAQAGSGAAQDRHERVWNGPHPGRTDIFEMSGPWSASWVCLACTGVDVLSSDDVLVRQVRSDAGSSFPTFRASVENMPAGKYYLKFYARGGWRVQVDGPFR